jgi:hypothetical protein
MLAKACATNTRNFRLWRGALAPRRPLVCAQAREGVRGKSRITQRHLPYQFEKQRQRAWRSLGDAFMLQRTMLR